MFDNEEIVITATLKRAKLLTRKTGKTTIHYRNGFVKVVLSLFETTLTWEILKTYNFLKVIKVIRKKRKGDKVRGLIIASISTAKDSERLWRFMFDRSKHFKLSLSFDDRNTNVKCIRRWRRMLRGRGTFNLPFGKRTGL